MSTLSAESTKQTTQCPKCKGGGIIYKDRGAVGRCQTCDVCRGSGRAPVAVAAPKPPSKAQQIKSLMEDSGYSRSEATALVKEGFC